VGVGGQQITLISSHQRAFKSSQLVDITRAADGMTLLVINLAVQTYF
jgi:hypothetical protein